jgi:hypothetical protein
MGCIFFKKYLFALRRKDFLPLLLALLALLLALLLELFFKLLLELLLELFLELLERLFCLRRLIYIYKNFLMFETIFSKGLRYFVNEKVFLSTVLQ